MTGLTTYVLDTLRGRPASGLEVRLRKDGEVVAEAITNLDGRPDKALLAARALTVGIYRLEFEVGEYFRDLGATLPTPAFLETVIVEFGISDPRTNSEVALLISPFAYSTHRSS